MKQYPSKDYRHYHFDYCSQVYKKKYLKDNKKCEEGNMKSNMENVPKGHIIYGNQINIWNANSKYHTFTDHTNRHIHENSYYKTHITVLCVPKIHLQEPHEESC